MKHFTRSLSVFLMLFTISFSSIHAQPWTVGVPVNASLTSVGGYTGGCYPNPDFQFSFPGTIVTGVNYFLIVTTTPAASVLLQPGNDTLAVGDTIPFSIGINNFSVFCFTGSGGQVVFDIKAIGTPTTGGQPYPCTVSQFWISNLMLCPEGLLNNPQNNCSVQAATGIGEITADDYNIVLPVAANGYRLQVTGKFIQLVVTDIAGRTVYSAGSASQAIADLHHLSSGIYHLMITDGTGICTRKFTMH